MWISRLLEPCEQKTSHTLANISASLYHIELPQQSNVFISLACLAGECFQCHTQPGKCSTDCGQRNLEPVDGDQLVLGFIRCWLGTYDLANESYMVITKCMASPVRPRSRITDLPKPQIAQDTVVNKITPQRYTEWFCNPLFHKRADIKWRQSELSVRCEKHRGQEKRSCETTDKVICWGRSGRESIRNDTREQVTCVRI